MKDSRVTTVSRHVWEQALEEVQDVRLVEGVKEEVPMIR